MAGSRVSPRVTDFPSWPATHECHVWAATVPEINPVHEYLLSLLDPAERDRATRYRDPAAMRLHVASRAAQRLLTARYLGRDPASVTITRRCPHCGHDGHGRPTAAEPDGRPPGLEFSVTHTGELLLLAYVSHGLVGIDAEAAGRPITRAGLVDFALTQAEAALVPAGPATDRAAAFHRLWTRKEAVLKLTGYGLAVPLRSIDVTGETCRPVTDLPDAPAWPRDPVHLADLRLSELAVPSATAPAGTAPAGGRGYIAAVATTGPPRQVVLRPAAPFLTETAPPRPRR